jgi:lysyl endopeptidase
MTTLRSIPLIFLTCWVVFAQEHPRKDAAVYLGTGAQAAVVRAQPPSRSIALGRHGAIALGALTAAERGKLGAVGLKRRIGVHRALPQGALDRGTWASLPNGGADWRLGISSASASALRVHFSGFSVGSAKVWVHSGDFVDGPYTGQGPYGNGDFWSRTVAGDSAVVEYEGPAGAVPFQIRQVAHQAGLAATPIPLDAAASCNLDVNCYPDWQNTKRSVAQIQFEETQGNEQGTFLCSGSLVATRDNSFTPYLLTAGHCIHDEAAARSLQTFWAFESSACNAGPPTDRGKLNSSNGGHLVVWATIEKGDYSLVLLPDVPQGVVFSGWDTADPDVGSPLVGIHHPAGSYKRISFAQSIVSADADVGNDFAPASLYHDVAYTNGITQPGSSGSPLFSGPGVIVGMLTYGPALDGEQFCLVQDYGGYGKFSNAYPVIQPYLEDIPFSVVKPSTNAVQFTGLNHAITGNALQTVGLTVDSRSPVPFALRADAPWVQITPASGTVSAQAPVTFQVSVNPKYFPTTDMYPTVITILSGAAPPQYIDVSVNMTIQTSNVVPSAQPNPVVENGTVWALTLHLAETGGALTTLTGLRIDGVDYSSHIVGFFGTASIPASGTIDATIHTSGLVTPVKKFFEFFGQDAATGQVWYRTLTVTFTQ